MPRILNTTPKDIISVRLKSPKRRATKHPSVEKEKVQIVPEGVIVQRPDHLTNFTIDKPKIDFFKSGLAITKKLDQSEKIRSKRLKTMAKEVNAKNEIYMDKAKQNQKLLSLDHKERTKCLDERGKSKVDAVVAVKEAWKRDIDTYKEMKTLKK